MAGNAWWQDMTQLLGNGLRDGCAQQRAPAHAGRRTAMNAVTSGAPSSLTSTLCRPACRRT